MISHDLKRGFCIDAQFQGRQGLVRGSRKA
jgi:hypothetical protein